MEEDKDKTVFVTGDKKQSAGIPHPADLEAMNPQGAIEIKSVEQLMELGRALKDTKDVFDQRIVALMTPEFAAYVRKLRVEEGFSWRGVADECWLKLNTEKGMSAEQLWMPTSNQIAGMALCETAAKTYGEDYYQPPWN